MRNASDKKRKYTTITIPSPLFERIQRSIKSTGFSSVSDYATFVLRETVSETEMKKAGKKDTSGIMDKLKSLGYA